MLGRRRQRPPPTRVTRWEGRSPSTRRATCSVWPQIKEDVARWDGIAVAGAAFGE